MLGFLGRKKGMTQIFDEKGELIPVTVIETGPCTIVGTKVKERDGYNAIQLGFGTVQSKKLSKPNRGVFEKKKLNCFAHLKEFRLDEAKGFQVGETLTVAGFQIGDLVSVQGATKGRGFQGVIKKEGKHGGPDSHGSDFHRRTGSIGMRTWPGRVFKNMGLPGRMGNNRVSIRGLRVVGVKPEENVLLVHGAAPGARDNLVIIYNQKSDFVKRFQKQDQKQEG